MTRFNNDALNGYVDADGFKGAASAADIAANRASTQPALFPYGATLSGSTSSGTDVIVPVTVVATGSSSQSGSRAVISGSTVVTTCSGSTRGIRLSGGVGSRWEVFDATAFAVLVYPSTGSQIEATATNGSYKLAARKSAIFYQYSATKIVSLVGA